MAKEVEKPKEELAPAYFTLYSALWCVMLGFFVMLLSMGHEQSGLGAKGYGDIRDAFGTKGGFGLLAFANNVIHGNNQGGSSSFRIRQSSAGGEEGVDGYIRGLLRKQGLSDISNFVVIESEHGSKVVLKLPVSFRNDEYLSEKSVDLLERFAEVLVDLRQFNMEIISVCDDRAGPDECTRGAMLNAAVVARFLSDVAALDPDRVKAVGYSDSRWVDVYGMDPVKGYIMIAINRVNR